ncbi:hypothetical protein ISF_04604 [Cordyceps fumosorosea ARSEF 2679]|uniref:Uncharacterized protein n=1 Tax=Cordyceps fumosorosea (strain ARSEF 2679) TaxID=1081104 RepID=A0A167WK60_CORFA|nr:hypothetical protein ISF_04604 [Cordyceps fumosorosea ARSEF 2679]OAA63895.1 hypothetical protein ISF_04604 [Cordyceps fumosorosea ARSEF 2679]
MSATDPGLSASGSDAPAPSSSPPPSTNLQPVTYAIIPLVTLASIFLVGVFAYMRRRRGPRLDGGISDDGGEAQMQERRRGGRDRGAAADNWPPGSINLRWWFLRSNEGLNELGEAPPPYDVPNRPRKAVTEGSASATDGGRSGVIEEVEEEDEEAENDSRSPRGSVSIQESARHSEDVMRLDGGYGRRSTGEARRSADQPRRRSQDVTEMTTREEQLHFDTRRIEEEPQEPSEQTHAPITPTVLSASPALVLLSDSASHRQQPPCNQQRRASSTSDVCSSEFFRPPSPDRERRRTDRLNRRLRRLGYSSSDTSHYHYRSSSVTAVQLRDMVDGAAPPDYERAPAVAVPPPATLPPPLEADVPPPYPEPVPPRRWTRREEEAERRTGPPMVRQTPEMYLPHHHYLFMPPVERHDHLFTSFSASLDVPRHLHSRY